MQKVLTFDYFLAQWLNSAAQASPLLVAVSKFFAVWAIFFIAAFVISALFINWPWFKISGKLFFIEALLSGVSAWLMSQLIALLYFRKRPFVIFDTIETLIARSEFSKSLPSDHAVIAMALAMTTFLWSPKVGIWLIVIALLIGLARVMAGVHYPFDIVVAVVLGIIVAKIIHRFFI